MAYWPPRARRAHRAYHTGARRSHRGTVHTGACRAHRGPLQHVQHPRHWLEHVIRQGPVPREQHAHLGVGRRQPSIGEPRTSPGPIQATLRPPFPRWPEQRGPGCLVKGGRGHDHEHGQISRRHLISEHLHHYHHRQHRSSLQLAPASSEHRTAWRPWLITVVVVCWHTWQSLSWRRAGG